MPASERDSSWTLLTSHGHVLVAVARDPFARVRDLADEAAITERTVLAILADLESAGYLDRTRVGRRTQYTVHLDRSFRHPAQRGLRIGPLLELLAAGGEAGVTAGRPAADGHPGRPAATAAPSPEP